MPLTASGHVEGSKGLVRILAGIEALILAAVMYVANGVQEQKLAMAEIKASLAISQQQMATVPQLNIRLTQAEKSIEENARAISENKADIRELQRATGRRVSSPARNPDREWNLGNP